MYAIGNIFTREPVVIAGAIRSVLFVAVLFGLAIDEKQLAGIALAAEVVLGLFARHNSTPTVAPTLALGTQVSIAGTDPDLPPPDAVVALKGEVAR